MTSDLRARRSYARSLNYNDRVKFNAGDDVEEGRFICLVKSPFAVCVSTGTAKKYLELTAIVLPCVAAAPATEEPETQVDELPERLRRELGIGVT